MCSNAPQWFMHRFEHTQTQILPAAESTTWSLTLFNSSGFTGDYRTFQGTFSKTTPSVYQASLPPHTHTLTHIMVHNISQHLLVQ